MLDPLVQTRRTWKDLVAGILANNDQISVSFPNGLEEEPTIVISQDVGVSNNVSSLIIKILGSSTPFLTMDHKLRDLWKPVGRMSLMDPPNGYFMVRLETEADYMNALMGGQCNMFGHYLIVKEWIPSFNPESDLITTSPAWVRIANLPMIFYEEGVFMKMVEGIGKPLKVDLKTLFANKGRFVRVCVEVDM
ncbi:LOW QUALITY PROTEIN: hypothetical protein V2J09_001055 [Rumex salicifolius]